MVKAVPNQYDKLVAAGLQDLVLLPESDGYKERQASYWAANAPLRPTCIVQPRNTEEVSRVIRVLAEADGSVALRSGGHTQWAGSNDIHDGVTIDMGRMTEVTYDEETKLASVQPGPRWVDVYRKLLVYRVCVTGGREGNVGVAGFLTGGGNSYHASLHGFGCDNIANFEIVLADGKVINANANSHSDLWTALKGGSGNFGIVTRFDMYTFSAQDVWCGIRISIRSHGDDLARMLVDFTNNNHNNPQAALLVLYTFNVAMSPDVIVVQSITDTSGIFNAPAFEKILKVPVVMDDVKKRSMADAVATYNQPKGDQWVWFTLTFKNDIRIVRKASEMHDYLVDELRHLIPPANFTTQCIFQPLPTLFAEHSMRRGGNILGLDQVKDNALLWAIIGSTKTAGESTIMRKKLTNFSATVERFAREHDLNVDWRYLNYADETQDPLQSYGQMNVDFMRSVARKYDPHGVFQKKVISGWKISKVGSQHAEHRQDDLSGTML